jgi:UMF1 family MFS transporter
MNKRNLFLWSLYDFANSFIFINFLLYFSQWLIIQGGLSDFWYNAIFTITSILLFISAPTLASFTDRYGGRKYLLNYATIGTFLGYSLSVVCAYTNQNVYLIALFFLIGQYFYQLSFVFYNSLIEDVADVEHRSRASGIGQFSNSVGQVSGLLLALPLSSTRLQPLFPALVVFIICALPMMIYFVDSRSKQKMVTLGALREGGRTYFTKMKLFFSASVAIPMLTAYSFFNDALITITNNYAIYMERVFSFPDTTKNILLIAILVMSAIGGIISGWIADKIGPLNTLKWILVGWIILIPIGSLARGTILIWSFSIVIGLFVGSVWTVTRSYLSQVLKREELGYGFSFYTLFERFATLLGPLSWGGVIAIMGTGANSYRTAMMSMVAFVIIGLVILYKWKRVPRPDLGPSRSSTK